MSHPKLDYLRQFVKPNDPKEEYKILAPIGSGTYGDVFKVSVIVGKEHLIIIIYPDS